MQAEKQARSTAPTSWKSLYYSWKLARMARAFVTWTSHRPSALRLGGCRIFLCTLHLAPRTRRQDPAVNQDFAPLSAADMWKLEAAARIGQPTLVFIFLFLSVVSLRTASDR